MKYRRIILTACGGCVALLLVIALVFDLAAPNPVDAAKARTVAEGWHEQDLAPPRFQTSGGLFGRTGQVEFQVKDSNPAKAIRVNLRRRMYSWNWQVTAYNEDMVNGK